MFAHLLRTIGADVVVIGRCGDVPAVGMLTCAKEHAFAVVRLGELSCVFVSSSHEAIGGCQSTNQRAVCSKSKSWQAREAGDRLLYARMYVSRECRCK